ncbi:MAG: T9SS type A sorting domain-containing protein [candidate division Zixibacteria bacterium]|nr:T9SS type A sorting domain-containing protein [Candidatus Tariuqbacter arcticus]
MLKKHLLTAVIILLSFTVLYGYAPDKGSATCKFPAPLKFTGAEDFIPVTGSAFPPYASPLTDDPVGELFIFGTTWYDIQHNGTCGRQLQVDNDGWIHLVWMKGENTGASLRHIWYQLMNPDDNLMFTGVELGIRVDQSSRSGYSVMELYPDNRAMPCFHQMTSGYDNFHSAFGFDYFPRVGAFFVPDLPWVWEGAQDLEVIWPRMDKDIDDKFHIVSTENPLSGIAGDPQRLYYCRATFDPMSFTIIHETPEQIEIDWTMTISADVAASPVSNRVAIGWMQMAATGDTSQYDNNLIVCISEDGINWNWTDTVNVTNWIPPDLSLLPDTLAANQDTLRCYADMCLLFDYNDVLHAFFSTRGYYSIQGSLSWGNSYIWHWDEVEQVFSMVADGWFDNGFYDPGAWNVYAQRPSAGIDQATGDIYCMYQRLFHPLGPSASHPFPYLHGDTSDFSQAGFPNGEIWMTKSLDGGINWAEGIDVTNTHTPNAPAGQCLSELTPCMSPDVVNGFCHIFYIEDKDAGAVVQDEGTWTLNDAIYHRAPISEIPALPTLPPYPMHCDSTGIPGYVPPPPPDITITLIPENPPIIIPANGGSFNFNIAGTNNEAYAVALDVWTYATLPSGAQFGPIINVGDLILAAGASIDRDRTQAVPANAPAGDYTYDAYVGFYPATIWDEDHFDFTKSADSDGGPIVPDWNNWGESFDDLTGEASLLTPERYELSAAYPNPFNPETHLSFALSQNGKVTLVVYDITGREVASLAEGYYSAGEYEVTFDGSTLASGIYFARFQAGDFRQVQKMLLVK